MLKDFTNIAKNDLSYIAYGGANGIKKGILLNGEPYMLKIEHRDRKKNQYKNSVLSEYIASKIFSILEIPTQKVILGKIFDNNKEKLCVACKDFTEGKSFLYEFSKIKNSVLVDDFSSNGLGTELKEVLRAIEEQKFVSPKEVKERFWEIFIVDSYLGNFDRHNGNWGILVNNNLGEKKVAPVYDCGSCLYPRATDEDLKNFLKNKEEMKERVYVFPTSALKMNDKKINYFEFLSTTDNPDCFKAILKIVPKIQEKTSEINNFINNLEIISPTRKEFYCEILKMRKELILEPVLKKAKECSEPIFLDTYFNC